MKNKKQHNNRKLGKTYITQPISQADARQDKTGVALPSDTNVTINREWVEENKK